MRHNCSFVKGRFTGDPSYEYEHTETKKAEGADGEKLDGAEEENIVSQGFMMNRKFNRGTNLQILLMLECHFFPRA